MPLDPMDKLRILNLMNNHEQRFHKDGRMAAHGKICLTKQFVYGVCDEFGVTEVQVVRLYKDALRNNELPEHKDEVMQLLHSIPGL